jgi:hypothetical protein
VAVAARKAVGVLVVVALLVAVVLLQRVVVMLLTPMVPMQAATSRVQQQRLFLGP